MSLIPLLKHRGRMEAAPQKHSLPHQSHLLELQLWQKGGSWGQTPSSEDSISKSSSTSHPHYLMCGQLWWCWWCCWWWFSSFSSTPLQCERALVPGGKKFRDAEGMRDNFLAFTVRLPTRGSLWKTWVRPGKSFLVHPCPRVHFSALQNIKILTLAVTNMGSLRQHSGEF